MEHVMGVPLCDKWATMSSEQQLYFPVGILEIVKKIPEVEFPAFGSLYLPTLLLNLHLNILKGKTMSLGPTADPDIGIAILGRKSITA